MIDCLINEKISIKAMVDTGQPYSVVFPLDYLDTMGLREDPALVRSKGVMIDWPGTKTKDVYLGRIGHWMLAAVKRGPIPAWVESEGEENFVAPAGT
jgi:hypothetical protein